MLWEIIDCVIDRHTLHAKVIFLKEDKICYLNMVTDNLLAIKCPVSVFIRGFVNCN